MRTIAKAHDSTVARVALAWLLAKPVVTSVIIGARNEDQLSDNLGATKLTLTADDMKKLDEVSALPPEYPGWMLAMQSGDRRPQPK
jgi:aryl-alcohol dehydrogenase-like predicted oxidoreductase